MGDFGPSEALSGLTFSLEGSLRVLAVRDRVVTNRDKEVFAIAGNPAAELATMGNQQVLVEAWVDLGTLDKAHKIWLRCSISWGGDAIRFEGFWASSTMASSFIVEASLVSLATKVIKKQTSLRNHKK